MTGFRMGGPVVHSAIFCREQEPRKVHSATAFEKQRGRTAGGFFCYICVL